MFRIISIAFVGLILGGCTSTPKGWECYEGKYKKPTDLSGIRAGIARAAVEKLLGKPIAIGDVSNISPPSHKTLAAYRYFGKPPASQRQGTGFGIPHYPTYMSVTEITREICPPAEQQEHPSILVAYDGDDRVIKKIGIIDAHWLYQYQLELGRRDQKALAHYWREKPALTYFRFGIMQSRRQQDYWLCLNAYYRHSWAVKEMGRRHWQGERVPSQDKVLGYMWYSLAAKPRPAHVAKQNERRRSLSPAQLRRAEQLAASVLRNTPKWMDENPCDALPGG